MVWSTGPEYRRIRVAVGDCAPEISEATKDALQQRGVESVTLCNTLEGLYRALDEKIIDLVLYDYHLLGDQFVEVMQRIRRKDVGLNPFVTVVATMRESSLETIRRLIDGGVDDLIRSPAGIDRIFASIDKSLRRRKPFIVTYDYVGPNRPVAQRNVVLETAQIRVPNTLKSRLLERRSDDDIEAWSPRPRAIWPCARFNLAAPKSMPWPGAWPKPAPALREAANTAPCATRCRRWAP